MSVPLSDAPTSAELNTAFKTLETAWVDWHQWWRSHYPAR
jgi:cyanosortase A-associated protein